MTDTMKPAETYGRGLYLGVLVFVSLLSVAGNAVYAYAAPEVSTTSLSPGWAAAAHMIPPVTLLLVTEVLAMASAKFAGRGRAWALAGVIVIAAAAFALSFDALYEVAQMAKVRASLAWLVPVMLDVAIIVCTTLVLMASRQIQRDRAALLVARDAEDDTVTAALDSAVQAVHDTGDSGVTDTADDSPSAVIPPVMDTAADTVTPVSWTPRVTPGQCVDDTRAGQSHGPVTVDVRAVQDTLSQPADLGVDSVTAAVDTAVTTVHDTRDTGVQDTAADSPSTVIATVTDTPRDTVTAPVDTADDSVQDTADDTADDGVQDTPTAAVTDTADTALTAVGEASALRDVAAEVVAEVGTSTDVEVVERVLELALDGLSARRIADTLGPDGPSRTPVAAWVRAAKELPGYRALATTGASQPRPALVAVND